MFELKHVLPHGTTETYIGSLKRFIMKYIKQPFLLQSFSLVF